MEVRVDGKVAVVTGASRGIGRAVVQCLLDSGAAGVVGTGRRAEPLENLARELGADRVATVCGTVRDDRHAGHAVDVAVERFGSCDILVNNAATNPVAGQLAEIDMAAVDTTWAANQRAPLVWARAAWQRWMRDHGGCIVNVGSTGGLQPAPVIGAYNVSKAALHFLTRQLAQELAPTVRVNAVVAAIVRTDMSRILYQSDEAAVARLHPLGRLGEPDDIANAVTFLCSDAASWVTGVVMPVDGGLSGAGAFSPPA